MVRYLSLIMVHPHACVDNVMLPSSRTRGPLFLPWPAFIAKVKQSRWYWVRPGHVEQGATPTLTLGIGSDEIYRPSCARRQHRLRYQAPPRTGGTATTSQEPWKNERTNEEQISQNQTWKRTREGRILPWSPEHKASRRRSRYQGTHTHMHVPAIDTVDMQRPRSPRIPVPHQEELQRPMITSRPLGIRYRLPTQSTTGETARLTRVELSHSGQSCRCGPTMIDGQAGRQAQAGR